MGCSHGKAEAADAPAASGPKTLRRSSTPTTSIISAGVKDATLAAAATAAATAPAVAFDLPDNDPTCGDSCRDEASASHAAF